MWQTAVATWCQRISVFARFVVSAAVSLPLKGAGHFHVPVVIGQMFARFLVKCREHPEHLSGTFGNSGELMFTRIPFVSGYVAGQLVAAFVDVAPPVLGCQSLHQV